MAIRLICCSNLELNSRQRSKTYYYQFSNLTKAFKSESQNYKVCLNFHPLVDKIPICYFQIIYFKKIIQNTSWNLSLTELEGELPSSAMYQFSGTSNCSAWYILRPNQQRNQRCNRCLTSSLGSQVAEHEPRQDRLGRTGVTKVGREAGKLEKRVPKPGSLKKGKKHWRRWHLRGRKKPLHLDLRVSISILRKKIKPDWTDRFD